jgi:hypothetical protein
MTAAGCRERSGWGEGTTMRTMTAIMVVAVGAILTFAINAHPGFISPQVVGLVLMLTGITGLCLNRRGTGLLYRQLGMLRNLLGQDASVISGRRVPLDELLNDDQPGHDQPGHDQPGHDRRESVGAAARSWQSWQHSPPGEVSIDDTPTSPDIWGAGGIPEGIGAGRTAR